MAEGVNAVKAALIRDFGTIKIDEGFDSERQEVILRFREDGGLDYRVRVSKEFDEDYASGRSRIDLHGIGAVLRSSHGGRLLITNKAVISN